MFPASETFPPVVTRIVTVPTVSVVLPAFNRLQYLRSAVDSVFAQSFPDWELIIADDGSGHETTAFLQTLERLPRVRLLRLQHSGNPSVVRNAAIRAARGRYVAFLDSDDVWLPGKLEVQIAAHRACIARRWSYTALIRIDASGEMLPGESPPRRPVYEGDIFEQLLTLEAAVTTPSVVVERALLEEVGGFDEELFFFEEYDLWLRLMRISAVTGIEEPLVLVRNHDQHYSADRVRVYESRLQLLDGVARLDLTAHLRSVLRLERARTAASLATAYAACNRTGDALKMLWSSRQCAGQDAKWWRRAAALLLRALVPGWVQGAVRRYRGRDPSAPPGSMPSQ